jgi:hypothetical protein
VLSAWEQLGLVRVERRKIVVRDVRGLSELAERGARHDSIAQYGSC